MSGTHGGLPRTVVFDPAAARELRKLVRADPAAGRRVAKAIDDLPADPWPPGAKALVGTDGALRIRVGDFRIIYTPTTMHVVVMHIGHRRDVYKH